MIASIALKVYRTVDDIRSYLASDLHAWDIDSIEERDITLAAGASVSIDALKGIVLLSLSPFTVAIVHDTAFDATGVASFIVDQTLVLMTSISVTITNHGSTSIDIRAFVMD
jgi:hypothetical protein